MNRQKLEDGIRILHEEIRNLKHSRFTENKDFIQHGTTTLYQHCISVAYRSIIIASKFNLDVDMRSLVRGALLHDYYLYDCLRVLVLITTKIVPVIIPQS